MMMTALAILEANPDPTNEQIRHDLEGVLCRCTGYHNIVLAIQQAAAEMRSTAAAAH
jgi:carbon-monoxide dehydrogenase small subunit